MKGRETKSFKIRSLESFFAKRIFAIPRLQREFVWNAKKACDLLDSIYKGFPIGTVLIWRAKKAMQYNLNQELTALPIYNPNNNNKVYFIIDGQQRLSVLYRIMCGDKIENSNGKEIDFSRIYLNLDKKAEPQFLYLRRHDEDQHLRVSDILSPRWKTIFKNYPAYKMRKIKECRERIKNYKVPFEYIETDNLGEVRETFVRINSTGTRLSSADKAFTLAASFNLKNRINAIRRDFKNGFENMDRIFLLRAIALIYDAPQISERGISSVIDKIESSEELQKEFDNDWKYLGPAYGKAIDYLKKNFCVYDYSMIPSVNMIPLLATFFYHYNRSQPDPYQMRQIKKWFWYTGITGRYSGAGYHKNIMEDYNYFLKLSEGKQKPFKIEEKVSFIKMKFSDYSGGSSLTKAFLCMLASKKPRYLDGGGEIPLAQHNSSANKKNRHHIFPRAHLRVKGLSRNYYNSIGNITYFTWQDNIRVSSNPPYKYLAEYRNNGYLRKVLNSHLIPHTNEYGLWMRDTKKGYKLFLEERINLICDQFEKLAGAEIFED